MVLENKQFAASAGHGSRDSRIATQTLFELQYVYVIIISRQTPMPFVNNYRA